ncbi:MAG: GTP cyclohydrolase II [Saprospiraceae bacterium]|nr:GTP cyclohydrolase II [Saprospiraceae bacterium]
MKVKRQVETKIPTTWGSYKIIAFAESPDELNPAVVLIHEEMDIDSPVMVRIHSECLTGDVFHSKKCDCGPQLEKSMQMIEENHGILIYLRQEGRNIGLINKLKAYKLQEEGMDTFEANVALGFKYDQRKYDVAVEILEDLGVTQVRLITNNPEKIDAIDNSSIKLVERIKIEIPKNSFNSKYLQAKKDMMGHLIK